MRAKRSSNSAGSLSISIIKSAILQKNNLVIFSSASIISFAILSFLTLATTTGYDPRIFIVMNGLTYTILAFLMTLITSALIGVYVVIVTEKFQLAKKAGKKTYASGIFGITASVLGSGCPTCGSFIFGLFGVPLAFYSLPFHGLEIKALAIIFLSVSIYLLSKSRTVCRIQ